MLYKSLKLNPNKGEEEEEEEEEENDDEIAFEALEE
jgi:hypothetical protein